MALAVSVESSRLRVVSADYARYGVLVQLPSFPATMAATWTPATEERDMDSAFFDIKELSAKRAESGQSYHEFLRVDSLNAGVYHLAKYTADRQSPHLEDEVYYVLEGKSKFVAGDEEREVAAGSVIYVRAGVPHKFFDIEEDLNILVFFATKLPE